MRSTLAGMLLTAALSAALLLVSAPAPAGPAPANDEPLAAKVRDAIAKGKAYLRRQAGNGTWDFRDKFRGGIYPTGGTVSLALLAMITCGVEGDDRETVQAGLKFLRTLRAAPNDNSWTYVVSLQTMVFALNGDPADYDAIKANAAWLLGARLANGYWSYKYHRGDEGGGDASNTQYAVLALHEAFRSGAAFTDDEQKRNQAAMKNLQQFYLTTQNPGPVATAGPLRTAAGGGGIRRAKGPPSR